MHLVNIHGEYLTYLQPSFSRPATKLRSHTAYLGDILRKSVDNSYIRFLSGCAFCLASALFVVSITGCKSNSDAQSVELNGAGSTFVYPVMSRWTYSFSNAHPNIHINYQSIGSGGGVQQVKNGTVDFGASDAALNDDQLNSMKPMIQIPESAGPVCITYSLPSIDKPIQLSSDAIAGIFLGKITSWHDPIVAIDNPGVNLPNMKILVSHRTDGSGTTNAFTTYLAAVSPEWQQKVGVGNSVDWPVGIGGKGSEGVPAQVRQTPGAIRVCRTHLCSAKQAACSCCEESLRQIRLA
jgi:phosphate transport system substrate-binding protein